MTIYKNLNFVLNIDPSFIPGTNPSLTIISNVDNSINVITLVKGSSGQYNA